MGAATGALHTVENRIGPSPQACKGAHGAQRSLGKLIRTERSGTKNQRKYGSVGDRCTGVSPAMATRVPVFTAGRARMGLGNIAYAFCAAGAFNGMSAGRRMKF